MEGWIGDSALTQLIHLIFATCMPWFRKDFAAPDGYTCNWFAVFRKALAMVFVKHMPVHPLVHRPSRVCFSANAQPSLCIVFAKVWNCICCEILQHVSNTFAIFTPRFHSLQRPNLTDTVQHVFNSFATKLSLSCNISASKIQRLLNRG